MAALKDLSACECPVCFSFLTGERAPMSLPCGHTVCQLCIAALKVGGHGGTSTLSCPMCRKVVQEKSISLNVTLKNLIGE